ncbi:Spo0E family sporulation regulatory protein-aspartic acid phosphatase [Oceanobacillus sp. 1P07AA]
MDKHTLFEEIEQCRKEMLDLYGKYDLTSDTVISTSMKLDQLMNDYEKII